MEVVFLNYLYYECFCWVKFDLFSCIGEMIYLVLYIFVVYFGYLVVFVCIRQCCVRIFGNNYTITESELSMLFICEVVVCMLLKYCNFKFSVLSNYVLIFARSSLSTSFLKSKSGSRIEEGCDALFFIAIFRN